AHARDELGITDMTTARPAQAAFASAAAFSAGAILPLLAASLAPVASLLPVVVVTALACLAVLGATAARTGGSRISTGALRVTFWGALAMGLTAAAGALFGAAA